MHFMYTGAIDTKCVHKRQLDLTWYKYLLNIDLSRKITVRVLLSSKQANTGSELPTVGHLRYFCRCLVFSVFVTVNTL